MTTTYYKALDNGLRAPFAGDYRYPGRNRWTKHLDPTALEHYAYGYHVVHRAELVKWLRPALYEAEICPDHDPLVTDDKTITCRARLTRRFDTWNERTQRLYAADVAEHVFPHARDEDRDTLTDVLAVVRKYARGEATDAELAAAWAAARAAVRAARSAARSAVKAAAWAAACWTDARTVAEAAALAAAGAAALAAARAAARAAGAASVAERQWQTKRLFDYLEGRAG